MEGKLEMNDADHPQAQEAAKATARLLIGVNEKRSGCRSEKERETPWATTKLYQSAFDG